METSKSTWQATYTDAASESVGAAGSPKNVAKVAKMPTFQAIPEPFEADTVIIGGGLTGTVAAYLLARAGQSVAVLEKDRIGCGATGLTTGFLTQSVDTDYRELIHLFGFENAKLIVQSHADAIDLADKIIHDNKIECEFKRVSNFTYANDESEAAELRVEESVARDLGLPVRFKESSWNDGNKTDLGFPNLGYLELKNQAKYHPLKYLYAVAEAATEHGAHFFEKMEVTKVRGRGPYALDTNHGEILAEQIFVATYAPFNKKLYFKKAFYESYVMELAVEPGLFKEATYEDNMLPYHYFRVDAGMGPGGRDRLIIGGEDHRSDLHMSSDKNFDALEEYIYKSFPRLKYEVVRRWRGPIIEPVDGLAYIGPHKDPNAFYATGFSGNGMTYAHIAAKIISDRILGRENKYAEVYAANRRPTLKQLAAKGRDYSTEMLHGAAKNVFRRKT